MSDRWAAWLAQRRFGGSEEVRVQSNKLFDEFRRRVLEGARVEPGEVVLDVGCGEGLIGFGALELVGTGGRVLFSDVSADLLDVCRELAGGDPRCDFVLASADDLPLPDESVDVVTTRSVVIYLDDKAPALREFFRVLRSGGRLSMFEPINDFAYPEPAGVFAGYDVRDVCDVVQKIRGCYDDAGSTLHGWDERDLLQWTEDAGFADVELTLEIEVKPQLMMDVRDWDVFRNFAPNPLAPTLQEAMDERLTPQEQARLVGHLRPLVERGQGSYRMASGYVRAVKG
jgi:ubiquinone/menaquinone biosynthesis C-methylase UbiE